MNLMQRFYAAIVGSICNYPKAFPDVNLGSTSSEMNITGLVRKTIYETTIHDVDTTLDDIWAKDLTNVVKPGKENQITPPQSEVFFQVPNGEYGHRIMVKSMRDFQEAPIVGDAELPGTEENPRMLFASLYYNMVSKAIAMRGYGNEYKEIEDAGAYKMIPQKHRKFNTEYRGLAIRKAAVLGVEDILTDSFSGCVQRPCSNIYISNLSPDNQPAFDDTNPTVTNGSLDSLGYYSSRTFSGASTHIENIGASLVAAAGLIESPVAYPTVVDIENCGFWLENIVLMQKIKIGSAYGYRMDLNPWQWKYLTRFGGDLSDKMVMAHDFVDKEGRMNWPGLVGQIGPIFIFKDSRGPTFTLTGTTGSYAIQPGWVNPGNNDDRNKSPWAVTSGSENLVFDVAPIYGAGGLVERVVTSGKDLNEIQSYGYRKGRGHFEQRGIQTIYWSDDDGIGTTLVQRNVALFITSRAPNASLRATS